VGAGREGVAAVAAGGALGGYGDSTFEVADHRAALFGQGVEGPEVSRVAASEAQEVSVAS
jgi:hypothetical protein